MGRWRSEYRRTHCGQPSEQLVTTWRDNFTERRHLRETMMSSHFQLGVSNGSSSSSSRTESLSGALHLSPTRLRLRHLVLTSPERAPVATPAPPPPPATSPAGGRSVRFEMSPEGEPPTEALERPTETLERPPEPEVTGRPTDPAVQPRHASASTDLPVSSPAPPSHTVADRPRPSTAPAARPDVSVSAAGGRHRQRQGSPGPLGSPLLGYGRGERGCDVGDQRTYNVSAPATQVHDTARMAAERRRTAQRRRDAALDAVASHGRPPARPASLWMSEYQRCFCQPVWTAERARSHRPRSGVR